MATQIGPIANIRADDHIKQFSVNEAWALFDARSRRHLSIDGKEFIRRWKSGYYDRKPEDSHVIAVAMLLPLVGEDFQR